MIENDAFINNIINANREESLAIFIGAGISKSVNEKDSHMPDWKDLINALQKDLLIQTEFDYLKIAQLYYLNFGEHAYYKKLASFFPKNVSYNKIHNLLFEINPSILITTNWDCLIENCIEENGYAYSVIRNDKELVHAPFRKKLVKMHGDFDTHNIVFKEDDYINYSYNFPLIENYVRSVMSNHTILFIGYSYNDINIKQITKWCQNNSSVRPPMYLAVFNKDDTHDKYLSNYGIKTILIPESNNHHFKDNYSNRTLSFLEKIKTNNLEYHAKSDSSVISYMCSILSDLNSLEWVLAEQLKEQLIFSELIFDNDGHCHLKLRDSNETENNPTSVIYSKFINILKHDDLVNIYKNELTPFFFILYKANILGVILDDKNYFPVSNITDEISYGDDLLINNVLNFSYDNVDNPRVSQEDIAYINYLNKKYESSYHNTIISSTIALKHKNYAGLLIASFNEKFLLSRLKYGLNSDKKYSEIPEKDLKTLYSLLPDHAKKSCKSVYDLLTFSFLYKYHYKVDLLLEKNKERARNKKTSLFSIHFDELKPEFMLMNLINFVIRNRMMIDAYNEFHNTIHKLILIFIEKQKHEEKITLTKIQIFSIVKYIDLDKFKSIFDSNEQHVISLHLEQETLNWLLEQIFPNLLSSNKYNGKGFISEDILIKTLHLISLLDNNDFYILSCIEKCVEKIPEYSFSFTFYKEFSIILTRIHNKLYKTIHFKDLSVIINKLILNVILKISTGYLSHQEQLSFIQFGIDRIFMLGLAHNVEYTQKNIVQQILNIFAENSDYDKVRHCHSLLIPLYQISTPLVKSIISEFIASINTEHLSDDIKIIFKIIKINTKIDKYTSVDLDNFKTYIDNLDPKIYSTAYDSIYRGLKNSHKIFRRKIFRELADEIKSIINSFRSKKGMQLID